ncbi:MAG: MFS transporter [Clostridia bacterium]|nr:MFS transporter [Clostridia bacterium]
MTKSAIQWQTSLKERNSYLVYFSGQNVFYFLVANFLTTYLMMTGIDMVKASAVVMAVKVWDAVNDALFGALFDKVKFKNGQKCLPWVRISTVLIPVASVMLFAIPTASSETVKLIWFGIAYIFWDTAYTICDVPIYTMVTTITSNLDERNILMARRQILSGVGMGIITIAFTVLPGEYVGLSYTWTVVIVSLLAAAMMVPIGITGKERNYVPSANDGSFTMKEMFSYLFKNKYLLLFYGAYIIANACLTNSSLNLIASYYLFGNSMFNLIISVLSAAPQFIAALVVPALVRKFDKFKVYFWSNVAMIVTGLAIFIAGYDNVVFFVVLTVIRSVPAAIVGVMNFMFTPDCAEYGKYKTGTEAKGITFAIQTFSVKIAAAVASALSLFALGCFGWKEVTASSFEELATMGVTQTPEALKGLWITYALIPVVGYILSMGLYIFYKLNDKDVQIMAKCNSGEITREEAEKQLSRKY